MGGRRIRDGRGQGLQPQSSRRSTPAAPPRPLRLAHLSASPPRASPADKGGRETVVVFVKRAVRVAVMRGPAPRGPGKPPRLAGLFFP